MKNFTCKICSKEFPHSMRAGTVRRCKSCNWLHFQKPRVDANKEAFRKKQAEWVEKNRDKVRAQKNRWKEANLDKYRATRAAGKKHIKQATPKWLTDLQKEAIAHKYEMARLRTIAHGEQYVVDHIIPLRGKNVCGLHVPNNLEVVKASYNLKKSNKRVTYE